MRYRVYLPLVLVIPMLALSPEVCEGLTTTVINTNDNGAGSLRQAIYDINTSAPPNTVNFNIPGAPPLVIALTSALPNVLQSVLIDGASQPGYGGIPLVWLDGSVLSFPNVGLNLVASNITVRGLVVDQFPNHGIQISRDSNTVEACYVINNGANGIQSYMSYHMIGGTNASSRNFISGNAQDGIAIQGVFGASNVVISGNYIGLNPTNLLVADRMPNGGHGIYVENAADNRILGSLPAQQVISGNVDDGIRINGTNATGNRITGNHIGTDSTGNLAMSNGVGIVIFNAPYNVIGGTNASDRNVISGNAGSGVEIWNTHDTEVRGNYIGLRVSGSGAISNARYGVYIDSAPTNRIAGNVVSGNGSAGIVLNGTGSTGNRVEGNRIGLDAIGAAAPNGLHGVWLFHAPGNTIGGTGAVSRNEIVKHSEVGIYIQGSGARGNLVEGNWIGLTTNGTVAGNGTGVHISGAPGNTIGGPGPSYRNIISANVLDGIKISNPGATGNVIAANHIGTDPAGTQEVGNVNGIEIQQSGNTIGGTNGTSGNLISANWQYGIWISDTAAVHTVIQGNLIGQMVYDAPSLANVDGVIVGAHSCVVGGTSTNARNVISGNDSIGITILQSATGTVVQGNYIGITLDGQSNRPNCTKSGQGAIYIASRGNLIGGMSPGAGNVISGNDAPGLYLTGSNAAHNTIAGNYIGLNAQGNGAISNATYGMYLFNAPSNTIGGTSPGARNVISGNGTIGIALFGSDADGNELVGNYIGLDASGSVAIPNRGDGIYINGGDGNTIGGTVPGSRNVISGNKDDGIELYNRADNNLVVGNYIGTDASGMSAMGNGQVGLRLIDSSLNTIGGPSFVAGNRIAFNQTHAVTIVDPGFIAVKNTIIGNEIYSNATSYGIDLNQDGHTPNDAPPDLDTGPNGLQNYPSVTNAISGSTYVQGTLTSEYSQTYWVDFYASDSTQREGKVYLGGTNVTTDGSGAAAFSLYLPGTAPVGWWVCGTATRDDGTSEFGRGAQAAAATDTDGDGMPDLWETQHGLNPSVSNAPTADADFDTVPDLYEYFGDTHPTNGQSYPEIIAVTHASPAAVMFPSSAGRYYDLDYTTNLLSAGWSNVSQDTQGNATNLTLTDAAASNACRIYRVKAHVP